MATHVFNIGEPYNNTWWAQNVKMGVITAGWDGEPGDRGTEVMQALAEGDWIIAFANRSGYIGYGQVMAGRTYEILLDKDLPKDWTSHHRHIRGVRWDHVIEKLADGIHPDVAGRASPRNTRESVPNDALAERIMGMIRDKGVVPDRAPPRVPREDWRWVAEGVQALYRILKRPVATTEVSAYINHFRPDYRPSNTEPELTMLTVNSNSRGGHPRKRDNGNMLSDPPQTYDILFKKPYVQGKNRVGYVPYEPAKHGVWELYPDERGKVRCVKAGAEVSLIEATFEEAQEDDDENAEGALPIDGDEDQRKKLMGEIIHRRGQSKFRNDLLDAYENQCAVTGSSTRAVLEAAHIKPYRGDRSDRVDNGLLLRSDIHTLFDLGQLYIEPDTYIIRVVEALHETEYGKFDGQFLRLPKRKTHRPLTAHLEDHIKAANAPWVNVVAQR